MRSLIWQSTGATAVTTVRVDGSCLIELISIIKRLRRLRAANVMTCEAQLPFKHNRLRCVRCVNENHKKRKRLRWQAANHGCHCFDRSFLLAGVCVCCVKSACVSCGFRLRNARVQRKRLRLNGNRASAMCFTPSSLSLSLFLIGQTMPVVI